MKKQAGGLQSLAAKVASKGRNGDTMLVHMQPREVAALAQLAAKQGDPVTMNPETGMPEMFSLWKTLLGIGAIAAAPFTGGISAALGLPLAAGTSAALGTIGATLGGSLLGSGLKPDGTSATQTEADRIKKLQDQAQNMVNVPIVRNIPGPVATPKTGLPGVTPEPMGMSQQVTGYIKPAQGYYAKGGAVKGGNENQIILDALAALRGESANPEAALKAFAARFGVDGLKSFVQEMSPAQQKPPVRGGLQDVRSHGGKLSGPGAGMDDLIPANVDGQRDVLLSNDEYVVPADVVAHLGDGSSEAGARRLDEMRDRVRAEKTGTTVQPGKINPRKVLPR